MSELSGIGFDALVKRGKNCTLWGHSANNMTRGQLLGLIGYLDSVIERERENVTPAPTCDDDAGNLDAATGCVCAFAIVALVVGIPLAAWLGYVWHGVPQ